MMHGGSGESDGNIINIEDLPTWNGTDVPSYNCANTTKEEPPFPCDPDINDKLILWSGALPNLRTHVIVDVFNEQFNQWIVAKSGLQLAEEMAHERKQCRTGDARIFRCNNVPCRFVIRVVTPRFNEKYISAAESALYNCYRNTLLLAIEQNLPTIVLEPLHLTTRGYPLELGAHIALRTVRRLLERHRGKIQRIMFHCTSTEYTAVYNQLAPLYFPRNRSEELHSIRNRPSDIGNEFGEPVHPDREIRISAHPRKKPGFHPLHTSHQSSASDSMSSHSEDENSQSTVPMEVGTDALSAVHSHVAAQPSATRRPTAPAGPSAAALEDIRALAPGSHSFARMETDPDTRRRHSAYVSKAAAGQAGKPGAVAPVPADPARLGGAAGEAFQRERRYQRLLRQAMHPQRARDMGSVAALRVLYQCGTDVNNRAIVLVVGRSLDWNQITENNALLYFMHYMDRIVNQEYIVVYLQTLTTSSNQPSSELIRRIYENTDDRYRRNLRGLYLMHTSLWNRMVTWFLATFSGPDLKSHIHQVLNLSHLYRLINPRQLDLPEFVYEYDRKLYGTTTQSPVGNGSSSVPSSGRSAPNVSSNSGDANL